MATATKPRARTFRHLMADARIEDWAELARRAAVYPQQVSHLKDGWKGTPELRARIAKALGVSVDDVLAAAKAAHDEG